MIEFATRADLLRFRDQKTIDERVALRKRAESREPSSSTFLSHSSQDDELVVGAISVLEGHGAAVYLDKKDPYLPPYTSEETAKILKKRIQQTNRFVLLASEKSKDSRWVPWELGVADGYKGQDRVAVFPAVESRSAISWTSWEYLGLYPRIVWGDLEGYTEKVWMVKDSKVNIATHLSHWLKGL